MTRYFKDADHGTIWRFAEDGGCHVRLADSSEWTDSIFTSLTEFMEDPDGSVMEISPEEGQQ